MAALTAALIAGGLAAGALLGGAGKKAPKAPAAPAMPTAPDLTVANDQKAAAVTQMRKRRSVDTPSTFGGTLLTGPSGLASQAPTVRKTLLGT